MAISTMIANARSHRHGCNVSTCPDSKCNSSGVCRNHPVPFVAAPSIGKQCLVYCGDRCDCQPELPFSGYGEYSPISVRTSSVSPRRTLIAFTGLAGSGKSTAATFLVREYGFTRIRFAGPLKDMMRALGLNEREIEGDLKEKPCELLGGKTPRYAMQTVGTEWGRDLIAPDLWIRAFNAALAKVPAGVPVVVDDCRFPNEAEAIRAAGGVLVRIERAGAGSGAAGHSSETHQLPTIATITNDADSPAVFCHRDVANLIRNLSWAIEPRQS